jgi:histidyl-tRNA synthetase
MEINLEQKYKGTRIITGEETKNRRRILNFFINYVEQKGFNEIILPSIEPMKTYIDKVGGEVVDQTFNFTDKSSRHICLRPEGTATIQLIADTQWKYTKDVKVWYFEKCWRYERPQMGRYREFFQFGVEWINPSSDAKDILIDMAETMVSKVTPEFETLRSVRRGLSYYTEDGFEIIVPSLGAQKQVVGGGAYKQGIGFAIGFDRLMLTK